MKFNWGYLKDNLNICHNFVHVLFCFVLLFELIITVLNCQQPKQVVLYIMWYY